VSGEQPTRGAVNIRDIMGVSPLKRCKYIIIYKPPYCQWHSAVNIVDIVGASGGQPTKGAVNIGDIVGVSRGLS